MEDDGKLFDFKRLDKEVEELSEDKVDWRNTFRDSYKWYYPYAELSSCEEHLARLVERLAEQAVSSGTAAPTDNEVIGYMLLDLFATTAFSMSVSSAIFPAP